MSAPSRLEAAKVQLEAVQQDFFGLLEAIPEAGWDSKPSGSGWTARQLMVHMVQVLEILPAGIIRASTGGRKSLLSLVPPDLRGWVNGRIIVPLKARGENHESIARSYQVANRRLIYTLEQLAEEDWDKGMPYPSQFRTVEQMAYRPVEHLEEHKANLLPWLESKK
jgi:hypothetical protein